MRDIITATLGAMLGILLLDAGAFMLWVLSGQLPVDAYYFGSITAHILGAII